MKSKILFLIFSVFVTVTPSVFAVPVTYDILPQSQFGTTVSGYLTFDQNGIYFAGPFNISVAGDIILAAPSPTLPAIDFNNSNTTYVVQPNTLFHGLFVDIFPSVTPPGVYQFLNISFDSCFPNASTCTFEMNYFQSGCSDCPPSSTVEGAIIGTAVPEPSTLLLMFIGLSLLCWSHYSTIKQRLSFFFQ